MSLEFIRASKRVDALEERLQGLENQLRELIADLQLVRGNSSSAKEEILKEVQASVKCAVDARVEALKTELKASAKPAPAAAAKKEKAPEPEITSA